MTDKVQYGSVKPPRKVDSVPGLISPFPFFVSLVFHLFAWIFVWVGDVEGGRSFFIITIGLTGLATLLALINLVTPKRKKLKAFWVFLFAGAQLAYLLYATPPMYGFNVLEYLSWDELFNLNG